jgi:3-methyladenine DNA glycosylase AlkC
MNVKGYDRRSLSVSCTALACPWKLLKKATKTPQEAVYCENNRTAFKTLLWQKAEILGTETGGKYGNHWKVNG